MPTLLRKLLLILAVGVLLVNCSKWKLDPYDLIPQVKTGAAPSGPATTSVQVDCVIEALGANTLQEFGVVYSTSNQQPTTSDTKVVATGTSGSAQVMLNGLQPNTTYYYRTYAINNKGLIGYGETLSFKTATVIAEVKTLDLVGTPGATSFQVQVQVTNTGTVTLKEYGIVYSTTNQQPTTADTKVLATGTTGATTPVSLTSLQPNTTYYYRAYAITSTGDVSYGDTKQIKTGEPAPVVQTQDPVGTPSSSSAVLQAQVSNASQITLKEYGVVYSPTSQTPTIADSKAVASGVTGASVSLIVSNLQPNTTYYYRSYATNGAGTTIYGDVKQFKTGAATPTVSTVALLNTKPLQLGNISATVSFTVDPAAAVTEYGMVLTPDPNQISALMAGTAAPVRRFVTAAPANGKIDFEIKDLTENSPYYAVAFAKDATGKTVFSKEFAGFQTKFGQRGNWRQLANLPTQRAYVFNPMFTINGKVYVGSQSTGTSSEYYYFKQLYEYDPATNLWTQKKDFPGSGRTETTVAVLNNKAYILFGTNKGSYTPDAWEYDPSGDSWRQLSNPPATKTGGQGIYNQQAGGIPFVYNNRVYSLFGRGPSTDPSLTNIYNSQYALDPTGNGTWEVSFPFNDKGLTNDVIYAAARSSAFSFQNGNILYFGGGLVASAYTSSFGPTYASYFNTRQIWTYNLDTKDLKKVALLPNTFNDCSSGNDSGGRMQNCAFIVGSKAYIIDCSHNTWVMDLTTNATPTLLSTLNNPTGTVGIGVGVGTKAYFGLRNADWWEFTP
ncbi:hypothetical protein G8759_10955 [Spirosoma aureum]|uniref:Fibronectin type-III domain-containing protein n=1 Tax=Spirosoma aureum TaxID=2692134 RepID=A0A6G9AKZ3_9BACT|nr:hypothetical protein [Spirosoma aureum]QIP13108.1 hypothetical protein G8759_10955 [Spirosoma aureum]